MRKIVIKYGILAGLILVVFFLATKSIWMSADGKMDMSKGEILGYTNMILSLSMIFFGVREYRNKQPEGKINFGKAFQVGFLIALIASLFYMIGWMIYYNTSPMGQQFPDQYMEYLKQHWAESGMSAEEMAKKSATFEKNLAMYKNPFFMAIMSLFEILPVGVLVSLISAFILKRK